MVTTPAVVSNTGAKIAANAVSWSRNAAPPKPKKRTSYRPTTSAPACTVSSAPSVSAAQRWLPGSTKDKANPKRAETLLPAEPEDVLEADDMWSFVREKRNKRWLWTVMGRRTRQMVALVIGDRSEATGRKRWEHIPPASKGCQSDSDVWETYQRVFPADTHEGVGKASGQTNHMAR